MGTSAVKTGWDWIHYQSGGGRWDLWPFNLAANPTGPTRDVGSNVGNITYNTNNQVVDGVNANVITVNANNVTIRNFRCKRVQKNNANENLTLEYGVIDNQNGGGNGTQFWGITHRYIEIKGTEDGSKADECIYDSCYIHDLYHDNNTHSDGIQLSGSADVVIKNCRFENIQGSAGIFMKPDFGDVDGVEIDNNFFENVGNYMIWATNNGGNRPKNLIVKNNVFGTQPAYLNDPPFNGGDYQYIMNADNVTWSNNMLRNGTIINL